MKIEHSNGSYSIRQTLRQELFDGIGADIFIITDMNVAACLGNAMPSLVPTLTLAPGEQNKTIKVFGKCLEWLSLQGASRKSTVVAFGGGVIGDLAGFVAASYMRGVPFIQIPTTLLAQVDSSVGGKVGIDLETSKNMVGAFYSPREVRLCVDLLQALPARQFVNGMAEVWKYGAIMDRSLFHLLGQLELAPDSAQLDEIVMRCIGHKASIVEQDEFETTGRRAILNFGHTIGHALEVLTEFGPLLHGEAVSIGMVTEAKLGERLGVTEMGTTAILTKALDGQGLPTQHEKLGDIDDMIRAMRRDKKAVGGRLAFSLLTHIGGCKLVENVAESEVRNLLTELREVEL